MKHQQDNGVECMPYHSLWILDFDATKIIIHKHKTTPKLHTKNYFAMEIFWSYTQGESKCAVSRIIVYITLTVEPSCQNNEII
jgi:hypothetical protein